MEDRILEPLRHLRSHAVVIPRENVDTDQITPARFLKTVRRDGMKAVLFADWRQDPGFALNTPAAASARVLVAGDNFGCGSSREHAPWALADWGFRVLVSSSFADIFKSNCVKNGILPATVPPDALIAITDALLAAPGMEMVCDLEAQTLTLGAEASFPFTVDAFARRCLLEGLDELGYILAHEADILVHEQRESI